MATLGIPNGVNIQPSYYGGGDVNMQWDLMMQNSSIKTVRIEIDPTVRVPSGAPSIEIQARGWIQQACSRGFKVIATYHKASSNGSDDDRELDTAADWWGRNYNALLSQPAEYVVKPNDTLGAIALKYYGRADRDQHIVRHNRIANRHLILRGHKLSIPAISRSFIINVMNEWGSHNKTARDYAAAYNRAIATIRSNTGYSGPLIIDVPGWGQETAVAASAVKGFQTGGVSLTDSNIILSVHVYPNANISQNRRHEGVPAERRDYRLTTADLDDLASTKLPCMIGEFGNHPTGNTDWSGLVSYAKSKGWTVLAWAWNGDGGPMNMTMPAWNWQNPAGNLGALHPSPYFGVVSPLL